MPLTGYATPAGTAHYRDRLGQTTAENHFRKQDDLWLSSIGIGTYLGDADEETDQQYEQAVVRAVELGANVIDTAANYRFQRSERAIGKALRKLETQGLERAGIVVCTKGGYLPFDGAPPRDVRTYIEETLVAPGIASIDDIVGGVHCMTPGYLQHQIEQSLHNLELECLDVYYLHNPESQLGFVSQEEFYSRLRAAFALFEEKIAEGKIKRYGVATWKGFRVPEQARDYHSLSRMLQLAQEVGGASHGLRFLQLPFNLAMTEALTLRNQTLEGQPVSVIEAAAALEIAVVTSASILQGRLARDLPDAIRAPLGSPDTDAQTAIQFVRSTPGVTTALIGMSNREHVSENLQLVSVDPVLPQDFVALFSAD